jgi:hypothetical protein
MCVKLGLSFQEKDVGSRLSRGPKMEEVRGNWAKLQVQERFQIQENKMEGAHGPYGKNRNSCKVSLRKSAGRSL